MKKLEADANVSTQNVYKLFISSVQHKLNFLACTTPNFEDLLNERAKSISDELLPNLMKKIAYNQQHRNIFLLPTKDGGLNILKPKDLSREYKRSVQLSKPTSHSLPESELEQQQIKQEK